MQSKGDEGEGDEDDEMNPIVTETSTHNGDQAVGDGKCFFYLFIYLASLNLRF